MNDAQDQQKKTANRRLVVTRVVVLVFVIGLTATIIALRGPISHFTNRIPGMGLYAYPAIFVASIVANATIIIPVPGVVLTTLLGAFFNPVLVAIAAGCGAGFGELSGYLAGYSGQGVVERTKWSDKLTGWMKKYGGITVFILAIIPNPFFDLAGMTAGALKMPLWKFLLWCISGKIIKMLMFAYLGNFGIKLFPDM